MSVNGITSYGSSYQNYETKAKTETEVKETTSAAGESGVIYEPSNKEAVDSTKKTYTPNTELINKLKADAEERTAQLRSLVEKLMLGQGNAIGTADDMWSFLRTGNFTVDAQTKAQAQADIAEDGYWGVNQTSDRIIDFAKALTGGDPDKIEEMREAFKKGFEQAKETWGGELPEISQKTYDATMEKFDAWAAEAQAQNTTTIV
ncbi:MAG: hypothetical protein IJP31_01245 [Lachnospiraceae bacterium]|nr:hypothetical protein [Lachnospiraceae bacterium]